MVDHKPSMERRAALRSRALSLEKGTPPPKTAVIHPIHEVAAPLWRMGPSAVGLSKTEGEQRWNITSDWM